MAWPSGGGIRDHVPSGWAWDRLRRRVYLRDGRACVLCGVVLAEGEFETDHIVPLSQGGAPLDESNLRTLCVRCHARKSARERGRLRSLRKREPEPHPGYRRTNA